MWCGVASSFHGMNEAIAIAVVCVYMCDGYNTPPLFFTSHFFSLSINGSCRLSNGWINTKVPKVYNAHISDCEMVRCDKCTHSFSLSLFVFLSVKEHHKHSFICFDIFTNKIYPKNRYENRYELKVIWIILCIDGMWHDGHLNATLGFIISFFSFLSIYLVGIQKYPFGAVWFINNIHHYDWIHSIRRVV